MTELRPGDRVSHETFGNGMVQAVRDDAATVRFAGGKARMILASHLTRLSGQEYPARPVSAPAMFDAYLMVDWSANSSPKFGADSLWYCLLEPTEGRLVTVNPGTRELAFEDVRRYLRDLVERRRRTLVGFDFPYGYPAGTSESLGLTQGAAWRSMWDTLRDLVEDGANNRNNRFAVATELNGAMTTGPAPFWGCPPGQAGPFLGPTRPKPWPPEIPELRLADRAVTGPKSVWQLYGAGSVGSQALTGIPRLAVLRDDPDLAAVSQVWPFETGVGAADLAPPDTPMVVHAEIYPSLVVPSPFEDIKDAAQVRALAEQFAHLDDAAELAPLFDLSALPAESQARVVAEEGWILGVRPDSVG